MTTTYTDIQLKQALAKMLPEKVYIRESMPMCGETCAGAVQDQDGSWRYHSNEWHLYWITEEQPFFRDEILDTELLHLCWLVEETLEGYQHQDYQTDLCGTHPQGKPFVSMPWQQRVVALAKVKGIEIV